MTTDGFIKMNLTKKKIARSCGCNSFLEMRFMLLLWKKGPIEFDHACKELGFSTSTPSKAALDKISQKLIREGIVKEGLSLTDNGVIKCGYVFRVVNKLGDMIEKY